MRKSRDIIGNGILFPLRKSLLPDLVYSKFFLMFSFLVQHAAVVLKIDHGVIADIIFTADL